jgi:segregation and condensation protein B
MTAKLTSAALETLAVISYRQPMTRAQIEAVRGVNSDRALASLLQHGLVAEVGRAQTVGRPALFATTAEFLQQFGLTSLSELPHVDQAVLESQNGHGAPALATTTQPPMPGMETNLPSTPQPSLSSSETAPLASEPGKDSSLEEHTE